MQLNPIVKKDVRVQARSMGICWGVFAYELIMALVFFLAMMMIREQNSYSAGNIYSSIVWLYPILAIAQLCILGVVIPVRTASSISGEKERQTFDIMMTTSMTPFSVIMGKVTSAVISGMFYVAASLPVMALAFVIGGMSWGYLFWFFAVALLVSFFAASIGILCSSLCKRSITAVIMSYGFYVVFFIGTYIPIGVESILNLSSGSTAVMDGIYLLLLANPFVYLFEFFTRAMTGESLIAEMGSGPVIKFMAVGPRWMIGSSLLFIAISFFFLWLAARRINPIRGGKKKRMKACRQA